MTGFWIVGTLLAFLDYFNLSQHIDRFLERLGNDYIKNQTSNDEFNEGYHASTGIFVIILCFIVPIGVAILCFSFEGDPTHAILGFFGAYIAMAILLAVLSVVSKILSLFPRGILATVGFSLVLVDIASFFLTS